MNRRRRYVTFMMHRDGDLESRSVRLPLWLARTLATAGSAALVLSLLGVILYAPIVRTAARVPGMNREMGRLRADNARVEELAITLEEMEARYDQVRTMLGGNLVPTRPRAAAAQPVARPVVVRAPGRRVRYPEGRTIPKFWPLDERGILTRGTVDSGGDEEPHAGLDIAVPIGTPIRASGGGIVVRTGNDPEYGLFVLLEHPGAYRSMYGHASRVLVQLGDTVHAGRVIALSGSTGRSTAPHLHFEVTRGGRPLDPRSLIAEGN
jgi:murein DD-endopeptidase MepM/ murein hydrolase activator NlpD